MRTIINPKIGSLLFAIVGFCLISGCSMGNSPNPIIVESGYPNIVQLPQSEHNRTLLGIWKISINTETLTAEASNIRTADMHLNAVKLLEVAPCTNCLTISNIHSISPSELEADLTLKHPYPGMLKYTGFDVRGILITPADYHFPLSGRNVTLNSKSFRMLNPDGFTSLFNAVEFPLDSPLPPALKYTPGKYSTGGSLTSTLNPFIAYKQSAPRRMFKPGESETRTVRLTKPSKTLEFGYAVDFSWKPVQKVTDPEKDFPPDANCIEAYKISVTVEEGMNSTLGSSSKIWVEVFDHQGIDTISSVTVEAPDIFDEFVNLEFYGLTGMNSCKFSGQIVNKKGADQGSYPALIRVQDISTDQNFGSVDAWQVEMLILNPSPAWARTWGGLSNDHGVKVSIDSKGNSYVVGDFSGSVDFDPSMEAEYKTSNGPSDVFLVKYNPFGKFLWVVTWGNSSSDGESGLGISIDQSDNIYISGVFHGQIDLDPGDSSDLHISKGNFDSYLSKFDSNGNYLWGLSWGGAGYEFAYSVATDQNNGVFVAGWLNGTADLNPGPGTDIHKDNCAYLMKLTSDGEFLWAKSWGDLTYIQPLIDIATDYDGNCYVSGAYQGAVDFDPSNWIDQWFSFGGADSYLSKFDGDGNFCWARAWGGTGTDLGYEIDTDKLGNIYLTGFFQDTVDFDPGSGNELHTAAGPTGIYLTTFNSGGKFLWARTWKGEFDWLSGGISANDGNSVSVTGVFIGSVDFDPGPPTNIIKSSGAKDFFLSKFSTSGDYLWTQTWGGSDNDISYDISVSDSGDIYLTGAFKLVVDFYPGVNHDYHNSNGAFDVFLIKTFPDGTW